MLLQSTLALDQMISDEGFTFLFNKHTLDTGRGLISCLSLYALVALNLFVCANGLYKQVQHWKQFAHLS